MNTTTLCVVLYQYTIRKYTHFPSENTKPAGTGCYNFFCRYRTQCLYCYDTFSYDFFQYPKHPFPLTMVCCPSRCRRKTARRYLCRRALNGKGEASSNDNNRCSSVTPISPFFCWGWWWVWKIGSSGWLMDRIRQNQFEDLRFLRVTWANTLPFTSKGETFAGILIFSKN